MKRIGLIVIIFLFMIFLVVLKLYNTYASSNTVSSNNDAYTFTLNNSTENITLAAGESKTVIYQIKNTNNGLVKYGVGYSGSNIMVKYYEDTYDPVSGTIYKGENKFIKLFIKNNGSFTSTCTLSTILGYENGGDLEVPSGVTLVTDIYYLGPASIVSGLFYANETVVNDSITYSIDSTNSLIKDTKGNLRYYGATPNNYIYFNCDTYPDTNCELWRIIGAIDGNLKIIRDSSIGKFSWDTSANTTAGNSGYGINAWHQADAMKLLNPGFDDNRDLDTNGNTITVNNSLYYNRESGNCYNGRSNKYISCSFSSTGLKNDITKNKIATVSWRTSGIPVGAVFADRALSNEYAENIISNPSDGISRFSSWNGNIAVPNVSDVGYSENFKLCTDNMINYSSDVCKNNNWMIKTFDSKSSMLLDYVYRTDNIYYQVWFFYSESRLNSSYASSGYDILPTLFLSKDNVISSGDGSSTNPYRIV